MSDTPRTDKHLHDCFEKDEQGGGWWNYAAMKSREGGDWVPADFARELERENAELLNQLHQAAADEGKLRRENTRLLEAILNAPKARKEAQP